MHFNLSLFFPRKFEVKKVIQDVRNKPIIWCLCHKTIYLNKLGKHPISSQKSWHPSIRSLINLSDKESPMFTYSYDSSYGQHTYNSKTVTLWYLTISQTCTALNLKQTDTYWVENLGDKSCFHQEHSLGGSYYPVPGDTATLLLHNV